MAPIKTREEAMAKVRDDIAHYQEWIKTRNAPVLMLSKKLSKKSFPRRLDELGRLMMMKANRCHRND